MVNIKNWAKLIIVLAVAIVIPLLFIRFCLVDINGLVNLPDEQVKDFQYNAISVSATIGGFLFTGISILISALDKERIQRLWENNYLDNLYRAAFIGMLSNIVTIICAFTLLIFSINEQSKSLLMSIEFVSIACGIVFFAWCIKQLYFVVKRMKA